MKFNPILIGLERCIKNWENAEKPLLPTKLMPHGFFFLSPERDAGADEKQDIYFDWP